MPDDVLIATRQPRLFHLESALSVRMGVEFFRALPSEPGVYFFYDAADALLYIGQSADLRSRINSYRHVSPEKNPKRTLRLVARTVRIEWERCASAAEAIERERVLLLERRPPYNRAGVWKGDPWWLTMTKVETTLSLQLSREAGEGSVGPLAPGCRYFLASLVRVMLRVGNPVLGIAGFAHGLMSAALPRELSLTFADNDAAIQTIMSALSGDVATLLAVFDAMEPSASETERTFWVEERERLEKFAAKAAQAASIAT